MTPEALPPADPVALDGLFGWLSPGAARRGVVLCGTHGFEQLSAHRAWRDLAGRIAATGCATLRFDWPGEGDSGDEGAGRLEGWRAALRRAIRRVREAGAEEIALVGLRLGATLAAHLAAEEGGIDRLVLIGPFVGGQAFRREMRMGARTIGRLPDGSPLPQEPGGLTVGGFRLGDPFLAELAALDLAALPRAPAPDILLLGGEAGPLPARLSALGARVAARPFPELGNLVSNPLFAEIPEAAFSAVSVFAAQGALPRSRAAEPTRPGPAAIAGPGWRETPLRFGAGLFGIRCAPEAPSPAAPTVLFVNAGTNPRSGWGRQTTALARRLAGRGVPSLRMDLGGLGDSADRPGRASPLYSDAALADVAAALDGLRADGPVVLVGACSGAYLGFHAAVHEPRLAGALLVNLYCFDWRPGDSIETGIREIYRGTGTYAGLLARWDAWRRLLRGDVRVGPILRALARRAGAAAGTRLAPLFGRGPAGGSVARRVRAMRGRGVHLRLVYSAGDPGLAQVALHLSRDPARRLGTPVTVIEGADHDLSPPAAQARLAACLDELLCAVAGSGRVSA